jgi:hypothetical protein
MIAKYRYYEKDGAVFRMYPLFPGVAEVKRTPAQVSACVSVHQKASQVSLQVPGSALV